MSEVDQVALPSTCRRFSHRWVERHYMCPLQNITVCIKGLKYLAQMNCVACASLCVKGWTAWLVSNFTV